MGSAPTCAPRSTATDPADDYWEALIEFTLSRRSWWIDICAEFDLTPMQGHALRSLDPDRPVAMSVLADALICDASNVTGIVDKLESRGLIVRQSAENDRRIKMLAITSKGRSLRDRLCARLLDPPATLAAMPAEFRRQLALVLRTVVSEQATTAATSAPSKD
ncbi:MAG TPA: MarR family transcriptional regulator [Polyangia bacterium]|nr:MarR family transcriptional regulator [Polyangia bacterium]